MFTIPAFIIHVSTAIERYKHVEKILNTIFPNRKYIIDGDKDDLTEKILRTWFEDAMMAPRNDTSCAYKHILALQEFLEGVENVGIIFEDDVVLKPNFSSSLIRILEEIEHRGHDNFMLTLEDSDCKIVPKSERIQGQSIYLTHQGSPTAAYLIDKKCARNIIEYSEKYKINSPIDWHYTKCFKEGIFTMFRSYPAPARQATFDGSMASLISNNKVGWKRRIAYYAQRYYKKFLYEFR